jgi:AcrR family transcriptional regulator
VSAGLEVLRRGNGFLLGAVAREAGVSRQAIYLHFESRGALAVAVARHSDEVFGLDEALAPLRSAKDGRSLLRAQARFVAAYNQKLYPIVRMADAFRQSDAELRAAWDDRLASRRAGGRHIARQLARWGELKPDWTIESAGDWITALASVKLWEELVLDLGWPSRRFAKHLELVLADSLLGPVRER